MDKYYQLNGCSWYGRNIPGGCETITAYKSNIEIQQRCVEIESYKESVADFEMIEITPYSYERLKRYVLKRISKY